ncbi:hypothetical protein CLF_101994 [Clonorchis sinensis]|uniref:Uncharacterized protein n=1 Tax=Clonorchis sinensis TaxID=79923 RepID=G7Y719_CLOSI|nr:hypothetical protein CLF_101994 [Clonorchis sinensis]
MLPSSRIFGCFIKYSTGRPISRNFSSKEETSNHRWALYFYLINIQWWSHLFIYRWSYHSLLASPKNRTVCIDKDKTMVEKQGGPTVLELTKAFGLPWQHFRPRYVFLLVHILLQAVHKKIFPVLLGSTPRTKSSLICTRS